jgi:hypothetical protein
MSLTREHRQEDLSLAYILAVAAKAGYDCSSFSRHDYGIDIQLSCVEQIDHKRVPCGPILHDVRAYNILIREDRFLTAILVLYCMPSDAGKWLSVYERSTTLRYCGYWLSLRGLPAPTNKTKRRIKIPKEQRFTESSLSSIMTRIKGGGFP